MKARHSTKQRRGRPRKEGVPRTDSGRISRSVEDTTRLAIEAATWKRRRDNPGLTLEQAREPQYGSVILAWYQADQLARKRAPETAHAHLFAKTHFDTATRLHELYVSYMAAIAAKAPRSSTEFGGPGGYDGKDPFDADRAKRDARSIAEYKTARRAILESGPLGMMAVEAIIYENRDIGELRGDLRMALNNVERLWRMAKAA